MARCVTSKERASFNRTYRSERSLIGMADAVLHLKASPSLQYQNLSFDANSFIYVHRNEVHALNLTNKETSSVQIKEKVYQARICALNGQNFVVIACHAGIQFWDLTKGKCLFAVPHSEEGSFLFRGIAASNGYVFVGASTGAIAMIEVKEDAGCVSKVLREHKDSISDICAGVIADHSIVVSGDLAGELLVWDPHGNLNSRLENSSRDTVTCITTSPLHIICGYGSGKLRFFDISGKKAIEVAAHSRWINSIDFCEKKNLLATASEDMIVQLWQVPSSSDPKIVLKGSRLLRDSLLTGVKFTDDGSQLGCAAYDTEKFFIIDC